MPHTQLRKIRLNRGLTQRQLAIDLDIAQATVYKYENGGIGRPRPALAKRLSDYFGVPIEILFAPEPEKKTTLAEDTRAALVFLVKKEP